MDFNRLTLKSQEAVAGAQELARRMGNPELTPDHLTIALLDQELPRTVVDRAGLSAGELRAEAEARLRQQPTTSGGNVQPQVSARFSRVLRVPIRTAVAGKMMATTTSRRASTVL